jgi:hypothetical protein
LTQNTLYIDIKRKRPRHNKLEFWQNMTVLQILLFMMILYMQKCMLSSFYWSKLGAQKSNNYRKCTIYRSPSGTLGFFQSKWRWSNW